MKYHFRVRRGYGNPIDPVCWEIQERHLICFWSTIYSCSDKGLAEKIVFELELEYQLLGYIDATKHAQYLARAMSDSSTRKINLSTIDDEALLELIFDEMDNKAISSNSWNTCVIFSDDTGKCTCISADRNGAFFSLTNVIADQKRPGRESRVLQLHEEQA